MDVMKKYRDAIQKTIQSRGVDRNNRLDAAIDYALVSGGKRLRPALMLAVLDAYGLPWERYVEVALSVEFVHTYSLVHDDLPAMDDDALRRGVPTTHIAYDEATAILAGDALLTDAFSLIVDASVLSDAEKVRLVQILSLHAGSKGMVYGQMLDLLYEGKPVGQDMLEAIHLHKTAKLIEAPLMMGAVIGSPSDVSAWEKVGRLLGLAFQIQDDVLEVTSDESTMGKSLSDERNEKSTYVKLLGLDQAKALIEDIFLELQETIGTMEINVHMMHSVFDSVRKRIN